MMMQGPPSGILGLKTGSDLETGQGIKNFHWEQLLSALWLSIPEFLCFINWACLCQLLAYLAPGDLGSIHCLHSSLQVRTLWLLHQPRHSLWKLCIPCCYRWSATTWLLLLLCLIIPITTEKAISVTAPSTMSSGLQWAAIEHFCDTHVPLPSSILIIWVNRVFSKPVHGTHSRCLV